MSVNAFATEPDVPASDRRVPITCSTEATTTSTAANHGLAIMPGTGPWRTASASANAPAATGTSSAPGYPPVQMPAPAQPAATAA